MDTKQASRFGFFSKTWFSGRTGSCRLLAVLTLLAGTYVYITVTSARTYFDAAQQRLNSRVAGRSSSTRRPSWRAWTRSVQRFSSMPWSSTPASRCTCSIRPGAFYQPSPQPVSSFGVALEPLERYIASGQTLFIRGGDPGSETRKNLFSRPRGTERTLVGVRVRGAHGERYDSALALLLGDHLAQLVEPYPGGNPAGGVCDRTGGFLVHYPQPDGNYFHRPPVPGRRPDSRIRLRATGELAELAQTFNQMADKMAANLEELQMLERLRRELIANISHDLRTPVTAIYGYAETLWLKKMSWPTPNGIITPTSSGKAPANSNIWWKSSLSFPSWTPSKVRPNANPSTSGTRAGCTSLSAPGEPENTSLSCTNGAGVTIVEIDASAWWSGCCTTWSTTPSNTRHAGSVAIRIAESAAAVEVSVADTGTGIAPDVLPYIFDRYYRRAENQPNPPPGGMGLGLVIVKKILELHHAELSVQTALNQGSRFSFRLPVRRG